MLIINILQILLNYEKRHFTSFVIFAVLTVCVNGCRFSMPVVVLCKTAQQWDSERKPSANNLQQKQ